MKLRVKVGWDHIIGASKCNSYQCPIARAVAEAVQQTGLLDYFRVSVEGEWMTLIPDDFTLPMAHVKLPPVVEEFVSAFDGGHAVEPFEFEVELTLPSPPDPPNPLGYYRG